MVADTVYDVRHAVTSANFRKPSRRSGGSALAFVVLVVSAGIVVHSTLSNVGDGVGDAFATVARGRALTLVAEERRLACTALEASRRFFVGGNWKANGSPFNTAELIADLNDAQLNVDPSTDVEVVCAPPSIYLNDARKNLRGDYKVAAQNMWHKPYGAWTGEIPGQMLKDAGIDWVILGHSERRENAGESSQMVAEKTKHAVDLGLSTITCIGEKLVERECGATFDVLKEQMAPLIAELVEEDWGNVVLAYEPVWAIGTGMVATPTQAEEVHAFIRAYIEDNVSPEVADGIRILYGGSVTDGNSKELATMANIDGFLVGGASLNAAKFTDIINSAEKLE